MSATRRRGSGRRAGGRPYSRRSGSVRGRRRRSTPSVAATAGGAVGVLVASLLYAVLDRLPWWAWLLLLVAGALLAGAAAFALRTRRAATAAGDEPPAPELHA